MRADDDVHLAGFQIGENLLLFGGATEAAEHFDACWESSESFLEGFEMLEGEDGGGREDGYLLVVNDGLEGGALYQLGGMTACLVGSAVMLAICWLITFLLPVSQSVSVRQQPA